MTCLKNFFLLRIFLLIVCVFWVSSPIDAGQNPDELTVLYLHGLNALKNEKRLIMDCHLWTVERCNGNNDSWQLLSSLEPETNRRRIILAYDSTLDPREFETTRGVTRLLEGLNMYCRRDREQKCRIVAHSMGGLTVGFTIANLPNALDFYNIEYIQVLAGAQGGSEAADAAPHLINADKTILDNPTVKTFLSLLGIESSLIEKLRDFLSTDAIHALELDEAREYDHGNNQGIIFYNVFAIKPDVDQGFLKGLFPPKYDGIIAPHSACNFPSIGIFMECGRHEVKQCPEETLRPPHPTTTLSREELTNFIAGAFGNQSSAGCDDDEKTTETVEPNEGQRNHPSFLITGENVGHVEIKRYLRYILGELTN